MAAVTQNIGQQNPDDRPDLEGPGERRGVRGLGKAEGGAKASEGRSQRPVKEQTHSGLVKFVWIRRTLELQLAKNASRFTLVIDEDPIQGGQLAFYIDPPLMRDAVTWFPGPPNFNKDGEDVGMRKFSMFGEAQKMACPTWDLPAGGVRTGGSCPGADPGQTTVPTKTRVQLGQQVRRSGLTLNSHDRWRFGDGRELPPGAPIIRESESICQICYATGGNYALISTQLGEMIRYQWCRALLRSPAGAAEFVATVSAALERLSFPVERHRNPLDKTKPLRPVRVHSSGDFFSQRYAAAWLEVARRNPDMTFWAPTRTWAAPGWVNFWRRADVPRNFIIRPSAYHTDDPAPSHKHNVFDGHGDGSYPAGLAQGTTSVYKFDDLKRKKGVDWRYNWQCQTYAISDAAHSCHFARAPKANANGKLARDKHGNPVVDNKTQCRACWLYPDETVNYTAH